MITSFNQKIQQADWQSSRQNHKKKVDDLLNTYLKHREHQARNPILDFLFEYYSFAPSKLKAWSPGTGVLLLNARSCFGYLSEAEFIENHVYLEINNFPSQRINSIQWILDLLKITLSQPPHWGCFGMHEWAMVYKANSVRHSYLPLRFSRKEINNFVDSMPLSCTHYDAFRFFTREAKPKNNHDLGRSTFRKYEQPGCIHTNMDLYKWAYKMYPWISSNTILEAFLLALKARKIDMRASPYKLDAYHLSPIKVETKNGRVEYIRQQKMIFEKSIPVRKKLIKEYENLLTCLA